MFKGILCCKAEKGERLHIAATRAVFISYRSGKNVSFEFGKVSVKVTPKSLIPEVVNSYNKKAKSWWRKLV